MIFDLLFQQGQIKLSTNHTIPSAVELKNCKYCKWYNSVSHNTCECMVFSKEVQSAIDQGRIKFDALAKSMKVDEHPITTNMVEVKDQETKMGAKILTSDQAKRSGAVDPRAQISANRSRGHS